MSSPQVTLWGMVEGNYQAFPVDISLDESVYVYDLKEQILKEMNITFRDVKANDLVMAKASTATFQTVDVNLTLRYSIPVILHLFSR